MDTDATVVAAATIVMLSGFKLFLIKWKEKAKRQTLVDDMFKYRYFNFGHIIFPFTRGKWFEGVVVSVQSTGTSTMFAHSIAHKLGLSQDIALRGYYAFTRYDS